MVPDYGNALIGIIVLLFVGIPMVCLVGLAIGAFQRRRHGWPSSAVSLGGAAGGFVGTMVGLHVRGGDLLLATIGCLVGAWVLAEGVIRAEELMYERAKQGRPNGAVLLRVAPFLIALVVLWLSCEL